MERKDYTINAENVSLGRVASEAASVLRGKHKRDFQPNQDCGDNVIVENIEKVKITGKKLEQKEYYHHSGYPGGLKTEAMKDLFEKDPFEVLRKTVWNMLPKNKLRQHMIKRLQCK